MKPLFLKKSRKISAKLRVKLQYRDSYGFTKGEKRRGFKGQSRGSP